MANPNGNNQHFQGFGSESPYGDQSRQFELTREAPLSGAPVAGRAIGAPERQRSQRRRAAQGGGPGRGNAARPGGTTTVVPQLPLPYEKQVAMIWQQIAAIPGSSDLVKHMAQLAAEQANAPQEGYQTPPQGAVNA